ncbi:MAG: hypothetical protein ACJA2J_002091 [Candidatus Azotimanducaceae bacterium]|jgi:hypothetical protein
MIYSGDFSNGALAATNIQQALAITPSEALGKQHSVKTHVIM